MQKVKIPPYGWALHQLQRNGLRPSNDVYVFIGNKAWQKAKEFSSIYPKRIMMIPPWLSANDYNWPVKACAVLIFDTGYAEIDYVDEIAKRLFKEGASHVRSVDTDFKLTIHQKDLPQ